MRDEATKLGNWRFIFAPTFRNDMKYALTWPPLLAEADWTIIFTTLGFLFFWFGGKSPAIYRAFTARWGADLGQARQVHLKRVFGMLFFGVFPALILWRTEGRPWSDYGIRPAITAPEIWWILGLSPVLIFMNWRAARRSDNLAQYPEIRKLRWTTGDVIWSALTWMGYLVAYELMFRGFLLFACARTYGVWPAVVINTALYCLVHVPKNFKEGIGSIPLGLLLCYISLQTGSVWVALIVHWVLALSNEWFSLRFHPEMKWIKS